MTTDTLYNTLQRFAESTQDFARVATPEAAHGPPMKKACVSASSSTSLPSSATKTCEYVRQPSLRPSLPVEILDAVFSYLPRISLKSLMVANSFVSTLATRHLYHTVVVNGPKVAVAFLTTSLRQVHVLKYVRDLSFTMTSATPISNLYALLHRALLEMTELQALSLELPKTHSPLWIFDDCTFKLKRFVTSVTCRRPLAKFLEQQNQIVDLTLRGCQTDSTSFLPFIDPLPPSLLVPDFDTFILSPDALPRLKAFNAVHSDACVVQAVVQGRPVESVSIPLYPEMSVAALDALQMSSTPLKKLSVISFDPAAPSFLIEALAKRFEQLEALHLVMLMAEYNNELLEQSGPLLSNFRCLKYITFMAADSQASTTHAQTATNADNEDGESQPTNEPDEAHIAKVWHRACPSLKTIILPKGKVWFQQSTPDSSSGLPPFPVNGNISQTAATSTLADQEEGQWTYL
ncbi:hypothetical protein CVT26_005851 [Gymnopilus dilepis]|uniref:F-box domain-containing protein n=1 Tax=Gymnopilus dilepis TaxID=231916 RepID=A0A409WBS9_9AGAR|nr:hypothetical protein CVT26_005851 [Gymnopilus dilepis]